MNTWGVKGFGNVSAKTTAGNDAIKYKYITNLYYSFKLIPVITLVIIGSHHKIYQFIIAFKPINYFISYSLKFNQINLWFLFNFDIENI